MERGLRRFGEWDTSLFKELSEKLNWEVLFASPNGEVVGKGIKLWELYPFPEVVAAFEEAKELGESSFQVEEGERLYTFKAVKLSNGYLALLKRDDTLKRRFNEIKKEVASVISHEIKTPLTVIKGNLEYLLLYGNGEERELLTETLKKAEKLESIVKGVGRLFRNSSNFSPINLRPLTEEVLKGFKKRAEEKGIELKAELSDTTTLADPVLYQQLLRNLLDNAVKFTERGRVEVELGQDYLKVKDTGVGIEERELPKIFEKFYKSPESDGQGVGLAVVKEIARHHNWQLKVESEKGRGTTFTVEFEAQERKGRRGNR